jgi:transposase InsO family protein
VEQRQEFIRAYLRRDRSLQALCCAFGISRKTGYKWLSRFIQGGLPALVDRSRARASMPHKTSPWTEELIVACRKKHPNWGGKKIIDVLQGGHPAIQFPAPSTANDILKRRGLVTQDRRHWSKRFPRPSAFEPRAVAAPNSTWCADFKGHFHLGDGLVCYPATLTDAFSRKVLRCVALTTTAREPTQAVWTSAFREYGLPSAIRTDNGVPFRAPNSVLQLSELGVFLIELGIDPEYIEPGHPEQNGSHERMHRTLKAEAMNPPARNLRKQQRRFDAFVSEFNQERPHEALAMRTPDSVYVSSNRPFPKKQPRPEYGEHLHVREVFSNGVFCWKNKLYSLSRALAGKDIGVEYICEDLARVQYFSKVLAMIDEEEEILIHNVDWHAPGNDA